MDQSALCRPWEHTISRRQFVAAGAAATAGTLGLAPFLQTSIAEEVQKQHKQVLFIWLDGGMSQLESWDPKPNSQFGGPFRAIATSVPGIHISELLPRSAEQMHHLAIIRSLCTQDNSHSAGVARIQRGDPKDRGVTYPYFGSAVAKLLGPGKSGLPPYVWIKPGSGGFMYKDAGFLGPKYGALAFGDGQPPENLTLHESLTPSQDDVRNRLREAANQRYSNRRRKSVTEANSYVYDMARSLMKRQDLFDSTQFDARDVQRYGTHEIGRHMLQARLMLEAGVTFVKVNSYGWDTHGDNFNGHASLVPKFDQAFAAIVADLADRGMLDNVLVIAMSEFGRTPRINGHVGRDHWPEAWSLAMAGTGVKKGVVVGETNDKGTFVKDGEFDIGHMFHTWFAALDIDSRETAYNNAGQPLPIAHDDMQAIKDLLS
ncbi:MAG TPA: DUF1501 domain-containing protein [Planctomycetaceae bacterium]|nr:DUF1501 domain-containing protein [Planctomycetaceae bacterium]